MPSTLVTKCITEISFLVKVIRIKQAFGSRRQVFTSKLSENSFIWLVGRVKPEDHWSCIAHLSAEDMLKSAVIEEKKFKHSPRVGADNPFRPKF